MKVTLTGCARCHGEGHEDLEFTELTHALDLDNEPPLTHWAPCPANGEPILLRMIADDTPPPGIRGQR